jgi:IclR family acetate operon transcriptional repressor
MQLEPTQKKRRGRPRNPMPETGQGTVLALDRGLVMMQALAREGYMSLTDLSLKVGVPTSTAHRILMTLEKRGFAELSEDTNEWSVGIESFRVGNSYLERTNLIENSRKAMRNLMETTGETANLAISDDGAVVFISQVESHNPIRAFFRPGTRGDMHASGIGKALLANMLRRDVEKILHTKGCPEYTEKTLTSPAELFRDLETTRERGWAFDDEERYVGMRCIASCIYITLMAKQLQVFPYRVLPFGSLIICCR